VSEPAYYLRWRGQDSGPFTPDQIRQMWDSGQISGAYQVSTSTGMLLVQDFLPQLEETAANERLRQQQAAQAQAEAEQRRMEHTRLEAERARQQQVEQDRIKQEQKEIQSLSDASSGKKYHLYLEGQKKGPFNKESVQVMVNAGKATPETLVWTENLGDWVALSGYTELIAPTVPSFPIRSSGQMRLNPSVPVNHPTTNIHENLFRPMEPRTERTTRVLGINLVSALLIISFILPIAVPSFAGTKFMFFPEIFSKADGDQIFQLMLPLLLGISALLIFNLSPSPPRGIAVLSLVFIFVIMELAMAGSSFGRGNSKIFTVLLIQFIGWSFLWAGLRSRYYRPEHQIHYVFGTIGAGLSLLFYLVPVYGEDYIGIMIPFEVMDENIAVGLILLASCGCTIAACIIAICNTPNRMAGDASRLANIAFQIFLYANISTMVLITIITPFYSGSDFSGFIFFNMLKVLMTIIPILLYFPLSMTDIMVGSEEKVPHS
jgi:hypothetical protein